MSPVQITYFKYMKTLIKNSFNLLQKLGNLYNATLMK